MSQQYDFQTPVNVAALSSVSLSKFLEIINTLQPLSNIGGVIVKSGASNAHPDITNNARFIRYVWIDTQTADSPVLKIYVGTYPSDTYADWQAVSIPDGTVTAAKLANSAVTILQSDEASKKIAYRYDAATSPTNANYLARLDANGQYLEVASAQTVINALTLDPAKISPGANGQVLAVSSITGLPAWTTISTLITITVNTLALATLQYGTLATSRYILRIGDTSENLGSYQVIAETNSDKDAIGGLFPDNSIKVSRLYDAAAAAGQLIKYNAANWVAQKSVYISPDTAIVATSQILAATAHGLNGAPEFSNIFLVNKGNASGKAHGYAVGDIVPFSNFFSTAAALPVASLVLTTATIAINWNIGAVNTAFPLKNGTGTIAMLTADFLADFNVRAVIGRITY